MNEPSTLTERARKMQSENRKLRHEIEVFRRHAPTAEHLQILIDERDNYERLYEACLARNVVLRRKLKEIGG